MPFLDGFSRMKSKDLNELSTGPTLMANQRWLGVQWYSTPLLTIKIIKETSWCTSILEWDSKRQSQDCFPPMQQELVGWRVWEGTFVEWQGRCPKVSSMTTKRAIVGICNVRTCYFQLLISTCYSQHPPKLYQMYLEIGSGKNYKDTLYTNVQKPAWFRGIATFRNEQQLYHVPRPSMVKS